MLRNKIGNNIDVIDKRLVYKVLIDIKTNKDLEKGTSKKVILELIDPETA